MKQENNKPVPESFYQTGNTDPKKSHRGLFAILIMVVIFLGGIISVLGILNVQLFRRVLELSPEEYMFRFSHSSQEIAATQPTQPEAMQEYPADTVKIQLDQTPQAVANIPQEGGLSLQDIYNRNIAGVVSVTSAGGSGSGMVISSCGYILTNNHVLDGSQTAQVLLHDGATYTAMVVGTDALSDLAVLDVEATDLTPVVFGSDEHLQVGDLVVTIGDPLGTALRGTMTDGFISAINRDLEIDGRRMTLIQTSAGLAAGNAGGPLLNCYGQVIGVNTLQLGDYRSDSNPGGIGLAIPSTTVKEVVDQLLRQGHVAGRPSLGFTVETVSAFDQLYYRVPAGLFITAVTQSGLPLQSGDILLHFAGHRVGDTETLQQHLDQYEAGDQVSVTVYRGGQQYDLQLTLAEE